MQASHNAEQQSLRLEKEMAMRQLEQKEDESLRIRKLATALLEQVGSVHAPRPCREMG